MNHPRSNNSGKVLTIFLIIIFILMSSLTAISLFFFQKEVELRKLSELNLEQTKTIEAKLQADVKEAKKQSFLLEEKNKEATEKIESLMDELDLEKGVREEIKKENLALKEAMDKDSKEKEDLTAKLSSSEEKIAGLEKQLQEEVDRSAQLEKRSQELEQLSQSLESKIKAFDSGNAVASIVPPPQSTEKAAPKEVQLDKIVVSPSGGTEGKVLTVDQDTQFLIFNLGKKDGITEGSVMSVYRGNEYLGDIKVSRVQPEMSAADFIPPLTSQTVQKDDRVIPKT